MACQDCNTINELPYGSTGLNGTSCYIYIATASNNSGADFALYENAPTQCWKAIKKSATVIASPQASDFVDLWFNTCGTPGADGADGTGSQGLRGDAATINVGDVFTGAAGSDVIITNSGSNNDAVFNFTIPRGDTGNDGTPGNLWSNTSTIGSASPGVNVGDMLLANDTGSVYVWDGEGWNLVTNIMGPTGATGSTGATGATGTSTMTTVQETDGNPIITSVDTLKITNTNLPAILTNPSTGVVVLDLEQPYVNFPGNDNSTSTQIFYSLKDSDGTTVTTVGGGYYGAGQDADNTWYGYNYNYTISHTNQARRLKIKKNSDGTITLIGTLQRQLKDGLSTVDFTTSASGTTTACGIDTGEHFFGSVCIFSMQITGSDVLQHTPNNLCSTFPVVIIAHSDTNLGNSTIKKYLMGVGILCNNLLQIQCYDSITYGSPTASDYLSIVLNTTIADTKTGSQGTNNDTEYL